MWHSCYGHMILLLSDLTVNECNYLLIYLLVNQSCVTNRTLRKKYYICLHCPKLDYRTKCYDYYNFLFIYLISETYLYFPIFLINTLSRLASLSLRTLLQDKDYKINREEFICFIFCPAHSHKMCLRQQQDAAKNASV